MSKQSITFIDRVRLASPDRLSAITTTMRFVWIAAMAYWAFMSFKYGLRVKWLALFGLTMTTAEAYILLYRTVRTPRVIILEAAASVLAMLSIVVAMFMQMDPTFGP